MANFIKVHLKFILTLLLCSLLFTVNAQQANSEFVVVLDAGHGGGDPGNLGNGYKEKNIALKIVLEVGKALEKNPNIKVIYTRKTDVFLELRERAAIANKADADLFVSVHCNSHDSSAHGTETFVLGVANTQRNFEIAKKENEVIFLEANHEKHYEGFDPNSPESTIGLMILQEQYTENSISLARMIEDNFAGKLKRKSRGIKQASLWVLHNTYMPSVLVEVGFLTYKPEGRFLNSNDGQSKMASSIKEAILNYKNHLDQNIGESIYNEVSEQKPETVSNDTYAGVTFKVQIAASSRKLEPKPYNFNGLENTSREQVGTSGLYKYFYGSTSDFNEIKRLQAEAAQKGYKNCFIVAYEDGVKLDLSEVLKNNH